MGVARNQQVLLQLTFVDSFEKLLFRLSSCHLMIFVRSAHFSFESFFSLSAIKRPWLIILAAHYFIESVVVCAQKHVYMSLFFKLFVCKDCWSTKHVY